MPDPRLGIVKIADPIQTTMDWMLAPTTVLDETQALATAVTIALASDARAGDTDILPDLDSDDRRGWWGDLDAEDIWDGWPLGSKLWLLTRAKITDEFSQEGATEARVAEYIHKAIQPFVNAKTITTFAVEVARTDVNAIGATVTLYRGPLPAIALRYQSLWDEIGPI